MARASIPVQHFWSRACNAAPCSVRNLYVWPELDWQTVSHALQQETFETIQKEDRLEGGSTAQAQVCKMVGFKLISLHVERVHLFVRWVVANRMQFVHPHKYTAIQGGRLNPSLFRLPGHKSFIQTAKDSRWTGLKVFQLLCRATFLRFWLRCEPPTHSACSLRGLWEELTSIRASQMYCSVREVCALGEAVLRGMAAPRPCTAPAFYRVVQAKMGCSQPSH